MEKQQLGFKRKGPAVLVVEDDTSLREHFIEALEDGGYRPVAAGNLRESLMKIRNQEFDLVVLDLRLGEDSGLEVLNQLRKLDRETHRRTPVVIVSGNLDAGALQEIRGQVQDCLVKPFGGDELVGRISKICPARAS